VAVKKARSLGGARNRFVGSKVRSRSTVTGKFISNAASKRHPNGTIKERSGSGSWQSIEKPRPTVQPQSTAPAYEVEDLLAGVAREDDKPKARLLYALLRKIVTVDLVEVERAGGSMDAVVDRMLASIPGANVLDDRVGPFYDTAGLKAWFGISKQSLDQQARAGHVLCLLSADGFRLYPSFQFDNRGARLPRLNEVLAGLDPEQDDPWGDAVWLNAPADELDELTPAQALRTERADDVVRLAEQAGAFRLG
jgi:hypothetical protein